MNHCRRINRIVTLCLLALAGCRQADRPRDLTIDVQPVNPFTSTAIDDDPDHFQFAIVSDRTGYPRPGVFSAAINKLNLLQPQFVMCVGDLIEGYTDDLQKIDEQRRRFDTMLTQLQMPFFYTVGNHDMTNPVMTDDWHQRYGRSYYHFIYRNVLFAVICTEDGGKLGRISDDQVAYFRKVFADHPQVRWTFVFMHEPLWISETSENFKPNNWTRIADALGDRPYTVFAGHLHTYTKYQRRGRDYFTLATTGGGSHLAGVVEGEFDHIVWVTMTDTGPRIANLMLDGIRDDNIRDEAAAVAVTSLHNNRPVAVEPIFLARPQAGSLHATIYLTNPTAYPLQLTGTVTVADTLAIEPASFDVTLEPGAGHSVPLTVEAATTVAPPVTIGRVHWTATAEPPQLDQPIVHTGDDSLGVNRLIALPARTAPVDIDGRLDEWPDLPHVCTKPAQVRVHADHWHGPGDNSFRFAMAHDQHYVYLAVQVTDDQVIRAAKEPWGQDGIEIRLDGRGPAERATNRGRRDFADHLLVAMTPGEQVAPTYIYRPERLPPGVRYACRQSADGYNAELAVPIDYFTQRQGPDWSRIRLNIAVDDRDVDERPPGWSQIWWQPDWRTPANVPAVPLRPLNLWPPSF